MESKAYELAERLGMTVAELKSRMSLRELIGWQAWDETHHTDSEIQHAMLLAKIDAACGSSRPDPNRYLRKLRQRRRTPEQIKLMFMMRADRIVK